MEKLKNTIRRLLIQKALKNNIRQVVFPSIAKVKTIGFVDEGFEFFNHKGHAFISGVNVVYINFSEEKNSGHETNNAIIYRNNLNFWGLPSQKSIINFTNQPLDILFDLSKENKPAIDYICARSKAKFKVSSRVNHQIFDLVVPIKNHSKNELLKETEKIIDNFNRK